MKGARKLPNGNWVIPNSFQTPNLLVDELMPYLEPIEVVVMLFAIRKILGFQEKIERGEANISLSVFEATGLGRGGIRAATEALDKYKILLKIGNPSEAGQLYRIQEDAEQIDWEGLRERRQARDKLQSERTVKATEGRAKKRGVTSDVPPYVGRNTPVTSDVPEGVRGTYTIKPTLKPTLKPISDADAPQEGKPPKISRTEIRAMQDAFTEATNIQPIKSDYAKWTKEIKGQIERGLCPDDIKAAIAQMRKDNLTISWPGAVTKVAVDLHAKGGKQPDRVYSEEY
jgi:hypothetical protein